MTIIPYNKLTKKLGYEKLVCAYEHIEAEIDHLYANKDKIIFRLSLKQFNAQLTDRLKYRNKCNKALKDIGVVMY